MHNGSSKNQTVLMMKCPSLSHWSLPWREPSFMDVYNEPRNMASHSGSPQSSRSGLPQLRRYLVLWWSFACSSAATQYTWNQTWKHPFPFLFSFISSFLSSIILFFTILFLFYSSLNAFSLLLQVGSIGSTSPRLDGTRFEHPSWLVLVEGLRCLTYLQDFEASTDFLMLQIRS